VANLRRMPWGENRDTSVAADAHADAPVEPVADEVGESAEAELPVDLTDVGAEVDAVLKSAREAAASIRRRAQDESARLRDEAEAAAAAEVEEARQILELERGDASRIRAEAEAYAAETRAAAEAFAEQIRTEAEREAAQLVEQARGRLEAADAEVEQKVRQAEESARDRVEALEADSKRYEARLESMLVVFRGMSSQLEELLGKRRADGSHDADKYDETLEDALRPDSASSHVR
jgi:DNA anti-recombination protein RmuC